MVEVDFIGFLDRLVAALTVAAFKAPFESAPAFEKAIRTFINTDASLGQITESPHPHAFPDISLPPFGIEAKFTVNDSWRSVANSVFEGTRDKQVSQIFVVFGKMDGVPEVRYARYVDCVMHVRTSHVPRFELEIGTQKPIFEKFGVTYLEFSSLPIVERMALVRTYARGRLKPGERLWWLEEKEEAEHSLSLEVRLYTNLPQDEKRRMRAEAALLSPKIVRGSRARGKYDDVALYLLTYRGVLTFQTRDLFTAGSVSRWDDPLLSGDYLPRSLADIEEEMIAAALYLEDALFVEYWGESCPPERRVKRWRELADAEATSWTPSKTLFLNAT